MKILSGTSNPSLSKSISKQLKLKLVNTNIKNFNIHKIDNILLDSFSNENEYFSFRRASKLGQQDYGRCISVIKKI